jgi:hypothetical protein
MNSTNIYYYFYNHIFFSLYSFVIRTHIYYYFYNLGHIYDVKNSKIWFAGGNCSWEATVTHQLTAAGGEELASWTRTGRGLGRHGRWAASALWPRNGNHGWVVASATRRHDRGATETTWTVEGRRPEGGAGDVVWDVLVVWLGREDWGKRRVREAFNRCLGLCLIFLPSA